MAEGKKIKELLAVLDMSEEGQISYLMWDLKLGQGVYDDWEAGRINANWWLADLAFRLRDEFVLHIPYSDRYTWGIGLDKVYEYAKERGEEGTEKAGWGRDYAQPIHWILASLIAKELAKKNIE